MSDVLESNTTFCQVWNIRAGDLLGEDHALIDDRTPILKHKQTFKELLWRH